MSEHKEDDTEEEVIPRRSNRSNTDQMPRRGDEYMSKSVQELLASEGIKFECTVRYTPQQNGIAERMNRTLAGVCWQVYKSNFRLKLLNTFRM